MKKICLALMSAALLSSCGSNKSLLDFTVKDQKMDSVSVFLMDMDTTVAVDAAGKGNASMIVKTPQYGSVKYKWKNSTVYFEPGKPMNVTWDMTPSELTVAFDEKYGAKNNYITGGELKGPVMFDYGRPEEDLLNQLQEYIDQDYKLLESKKFDKLFTQREKERLTYWIYGILWQYLGTTGGSDKAFDKLSSIAVERDYLLPVSDYLFFMNGYTATMANRNTPKNADENIKVEKQMEYAIKNIKSEKLREYILGKNAIAYVSSEGIDDAAKIKQLLLENVKDQEIISAFNTAYSSQSTVAKGNKSPDFKLESIDGKIYTLADFKGRYVYIDMWATWCAPCLGELPKLKELEEAFTGTNIMFVSISIDKDKAKWSKMVNDEKMGGVQLYAGPNHDFVSKYQVRGIPRFILIDPKGRIVNANMTRPSDKKTIEALGMVAEPLEQ